MALGLMQGKSSAYEYAHYVAVMQCWILMTVRDELSQLLSSRQHQSTRLRNHLRVRGCIGEAS